MTIAVLRQRATQVLRHIQQWRHPDPPRIPPYAAALFRLAHIAVGDPDTAAIMAADVVALEPADERAALRLLIQRLPAGWLSWPGAAGPGEWLRLRLRREQADRVLSVLGEWDPDARIGLGLWLLWDVRRDEVDAWLGTHDTADNIAEFVGYLGEGLDLVPLPGDRPACIPIIPELIDADDKAVGRMVRLHILGCEPCRRRGDGLRATAEVLRRALDAFFRAPLPADFARLVAQRQREMRQPPVALWKPLVAALVVLVLYVGLLLRPPATAASLPAPDSASAVLDRALDRFGSGAPGDGVLHERVRFVAGEEPWIVERWYDYTGGHRMRLTVRRAVEGPPLLDLVMDGAQTLAYELNGPGAPSQHVVVQNPTVRQLGALLRQLPAVGGVGDGLVPQQNVDLTLLARARRGHAALLGATSWNGRPAYMVVSTTPENERMQLTIDRATFALLDARVAPKLAVRTTARRVWQTEAIEVLKRRDVPIATFQLKLRGVDVPLADPRQLELRPLGILAVPAAADRQLPIPEQLPEPALLAYLRATRTGQSIVQIYEGQWSTTLVTAPEPADPATARALDLDFAHGRYVEIANKRPQTTVVEFELADRPGERMRLYLWHALAHDAERRDLVRRMLDSVVLLSPANSERLGTRFVAPPADAAPVRSTATPPSPDGAFGPAERRFYRLKANQALQRLEGAEPDPDLP